MPVGGGWRRDDTSQVVVGSSCDDTSQVVVGGRRFFVSQSKFFDPVRGGVFTNFVFGISLQAKLAISKTKFPISPRKFYLPPARPLRCLESVFIGSTARCTD